jgi:hypothetical protein
MIFYYLNRKILQIPWHSWRLIATLSQAHNNGQAHAKERCLPKRKRRVGASRNDLFSHYGFFISEN